ncbi:MAG: rhodanese-like domain-containing protein [Gammaproteobacteria bacterium]|jgi:rhodanese-related sulfurtransferase
MEQLSEFVVNHWILVTAFCVVAGLLLASFANAAGGVSPQEAVGLLNKQAAVIVDVRKHEDFAKGHIIGALNLPLNELESARNRLAAHAEKPVLVCCDSGGTSAGAARKLKQAGIANVRNLAGGLSAWRAANLPVTTG